MPLRHPEPLVEHGTVMPRFAMSSLRSCRAASTTLDSMTGAILQHHLIILYKNLAPCHIPLPRRTTAAPCRSSSVPPVNPKAQASAFLPFDRRCCLKASPCAMTLQHRREATSARHRREPRTRAIDRADHLAGGQRHHLVGDQFPFILGDTGPQSSLFSLKLTSVSCRS